MAKRKYPAVAPTLPLSRKQITEEALASVRSMLQAIRRGEKALAEKIGSTTLARAGWME